MKSQNETERQRMERVRGGERRGRSGRERKYEMDNGEEKE